LLFESGGACVGQQVIARRDAVHLRQGGEEGAGRDGQCGKERRSGSPSYGGLDLSQEGRISLPTTPAALARLCLAYYEAAAAICDKTLAAAGGRGSPTAADGKRVPTMQIEARARGFLGDCLDDMGVERQHSLELLRQAVVLRRQVLQTATATPGRDIGDAQRMLADQLCTLGFLFAKRSTGHTHTHRQGTTPPSTIHTKDWGSREMVEAEACLREALALGEGLGDVHLTGKTLRYLINLYGEAHAKAGPAEAEAFRLRLNEVLVQMGRETKTSCSICLEPLASPSDSATVDAAGGDGSGGADGPSDSCVRAMSCSHQFHNGCISTWRRTASKYACPLCKS